MQSKQREGKLLAVVLIKDIFYILSTLEIQNLRALLGSIGATGAVRKPVLFVGRSKSTLELETQKLFVAWSLGSGQAAEQEQKSEQTTKEGRN